MKRASLYNYKSIYIHSTSKSRFLGLVFFQYSGEQSIAVGEQVV